MIRHVLIVTAPAAWIRSNDHTHWRNRHYEIHHPDHSAAADVAALRECYWALREIYEGIAS